MKANCILQPPYTSCVCKNEEQHLTALAQAAAGGLFGLKESKGHILNRWCLSFF